MGRPTHCITQALPSAPIVPAPELGIHAPIAAPVVQTDISATDTTAVLEAASPSPPPVPERSQVELPLPGSFLGLSAIALSPEDD